MLRLSLLVCLVLGYAQAQYLHSSYFQPSSYFRGGLNPSLQQPEGRLFFTTVTITLSTSTTTTAVTVTTTCTTSAATLTTCVAGRKRRSSLGSLRSMLYDETNVDEAESIFISSPDADSPSSETLPVAVDTAREGRHVDHENPANRGVLVMPESGFALPSEARQARLFLAFTTVTSTTSSLTTSVKTLTAVCSSTTSYQLCGSTGK